MFHSILTIVLATSCLVQAAPTAKRRLSINSFDGETVAESYIVKLKSGASMSAHANRIFSTSSSDNSFGILSVPNVTHKLSVINGYAGKLSKDQLDSILGDDNVEYVEPNGIVSAA
jgi:Peptidase inhibitor I9